MKQKRRKKKNGAEARGKRSTRLKAGKANRMSLRRVKVWNRGMKCMMTLNGGSIDRMDLSKSGDKIVNGRRARRLKGRNEKDFEIESGSWGVIRAIEKKQINWAFECDIRRERGCIESVNKNMNRVREEKDVNEKFVGTVGVLIPREVTRSNHGTGN